MYSVTDAYRTAIASASYDVDAYISIGTGIDITASDDVTAITGDFLPMSAIAQATDAVYSLTPGLATFEGDGIPTAISAGMVVPPLQEVDYPPETGLWSSGITDADGAGSFTVEVSLSASHSSAMRFYTDGPAVTAATITFTLAGVATTVEAECTSSYFQVSEVHEYDTILATVTALSEPYHHLRIVEVEFGAGHTLSRSDLTGSLTVIDELDPTELSIPMRELDLSLLNVEGEFDPDNPDSRLGELAVGYPISLSFSVVSDGVRWTVPMGRYVIGERSSSDTTVSLTAFDGRYNLGQIYKAWTLDSSTSFGDILDDMLTSYNVAHLVDEDLFEVYPADTRDFTDETSILDDLLTIQQAYAIYLVPNHDGSVHVTRTWPSDAYGTVAVASIISWPAPQQVSGYNYITIGYQVTDENGNDSTVNVEEDLRTDPSEAKMELQITGNQLIRTEARAKEVLTRIKTRLYSTEVETTALGDPAMDTGDSASIPGRWTQDAPMAYTVRYVELDYTGGLLTATVKAVQ